MKGGSQFFVSCGNASVGFNFLKEILYQVSLFIEVLVTGPLNEPVAAGRYHRDLLVLCGKL